MKRVNAILHNAYFNSYLSRNEELEKSRVFCHHDLSHFMDVARIAYIINLENNLNIDKEIIYASALLHDIGRWMQYEKGVPHDTASAELAVEILRACDFNEKEINHITDAILNHRKYSADEKSLSYVIFKSDKLSRSCFNCSAIKDCNWSEEKKNYNIAY